MRNIVKVFIFSVCLCVATYLAAACNRLNKPEVSDQTKACVALCGALDAAKCWDNPSTGETFGAALNLAGCLDRCMSGEGIETTVDVGCLAESPKCDLAKCVTVD